MCIRDSTYSNDAGIAHFLNSSLNKSAIAQVRNDVLEGRTKLLYFAPESLTKEDNVAFLRKVKVSFYAIDEAHCISEWGHDFRPEYRRIRPIINEIGTAPLIALTATATPKVQMDIQKNLGMSDASVFKSSFNRPNLYYEIRPKHDVDREIIRYIKQHEGKSGIIYCPVSYTHLDVYKRQCGQCPKYINIGIVIGLSFVSRRFCCHSCP